MIFERFVSSVQEGHEEGLGFRARKGPQPSRTLG